MNLANFKLHRKVETYPESARIVLLHKSDVEVASLQMRYELGIFCEFSKRINLYRNSELVVCSALHRLPLKHTRASPDEDAGHTHELGENGRVKRRCVLVGSCMNYLI